VGVTKSYDGFVAVDHLDLVAEDQEFVTLLGPSGCGKSTTLRLIAGLLYPDEGSVYFDDRDVTDLPPNRRNIGFVFQRVALFPHMNVYKNIAFGLKMRKVPKAEIDRTVKRVLELVRMAGFENRMPHQLSGGQIQRIEIARVLATDPDVLLFDEPLSNIDAKLRDELKFEIRRLQRETGKTMIYVTHDQAEAFAISDRIYVMNAGRIEQIGTPLDLYIAPQTPFVAGFIGSTNFIEGSITAVSQDGRSARVRVAGTELEAVAHREFRPGDRVLVSIRPEDLKLVPPEQVGREDNTLEGKITDAIFLGLTTRLHVEVDNYILKADLSGPERFEYLQATGKPVGLKVARATLVKG
jgi:ABC-type Fe3+/spermidine/putrescine transport system ATPase subunit